MKAQMIEYDDNGKTQKKWWTEVSFASSSNPPMICVNWNKEGAATRHLQINISFKLLWKMLSKRFITTLERNP